jgi:predicted HTH transcriptional regulator
MLARDVSAMANAGGGLIVIGFDCEKQPTTAGEQIVEVKPFSLNLIDPDKWSQILVNLVHPPAHGITVRVFEGQDSKGVAAIVIDATALTERPYIVSKMLDEEGGNIGSYFGYFQRKGDKTADSGACE